MLDRMSSRQNAALRALSAQRRDIEQLRTETEGELAELRGTRAELARHKRTVEQRLASARQLLGRLTAGQRAEVLSSGGHGSADPARAGRAATGSRTGLAPAAAPNARAARAVSFAYDSLGLPYVWGATGPSAYDCSGFTQAAWRSGGVSLPRTTYTQINAGTRVSRSQLEPGDLVFFYSGISHVGLYVGNGMMIHAPAPVTSSSSPRSTRCPSRAPHGRRDARAARPQTSRRAVAQRVSSCRLLSCSLRSTAETCDSTVFTEM